MFSPSSYGGADRVGRRRRKRRRNNVGWVE
jgi:hypothetical protein